MTDSPELDGLRIRPSARAVVIDPEGRVLLVRFEFPRGTVWATPGGGQEPAPPRQQPQPLPAPAPAPTPQPPAGGGGGGAGPE